MGEVYIWTTKNRPPTDAEGGRTKGRKNYRHKFFVGLKKVVTGQSQIMKICVSKVLRKMRKRTWLGHVAICCVFTQHFSQVSISGITYRIVMIYGNIYFLISNEIFLAEKRPNTDLRSFLSMNF